MDDPYTEEDLAKLEAYYNSSEAHEDCVWDIAFGYPVKCVRCQQLILISHYAKGSIVCETCEPNDDVFDLFEEANED